MEHTKRQQIIISFEIEKDKHKKQYEFFEKDNEENNEKIDGFNEKYENLQNMKKNSVRQKNFALANQ